LARGLQQARIRLTVPGLTRREVLVGSAAVAAALAFPTVRLGRAAETPIRHVVILMQENRSFDHYFGLFPGADGLPPCAPVKHASSQCLADVPHGSVATRAQAARGFEKAGGSGSLTYFTGDDLPYYWALAHRFTLCDRYFSSAAGATFPNRLFSIAGTAGNYRDNPDSIDPGLLPRPNLVDRLDEAGLDWACYVAHQPDARYNPVTFYPERASDGRTSRTYDEFLADAASGSLPAVSWVISEDPLTEHPPAPPAWGERFTALTVNSVASGPAWRNSALLLIYDEHGGFYDHLKPPGSAHAAGFRVPAILVSPYARRGHVSSAQLDHTSLIAFVSRVFGLPRPEMPTAASFDDCFDFAHAQLDFVAYPSGRPLPNCAQGPPDWAAALLRKRVPGGRAAEAPSARPLCPSLPLVSPYALGGAGALLAAGMVAGGAMARTPPPTTHPGKGA
jgi:phospholipase C